MSEPINYDVAKELASDSRAAAKYSARIFGISVRYADVMRRNGWRRLYRDLTGPWYRP